MLLHHIPMCQGSSERFKNESVRSLLRPTQHDTTRVNVQGTAYG